MGYSEAITVITNPNVAHPAAQLHDIVAELLAAAPGSPSLPDTAVLLDPSLLIVVAAFAAFLLLVVLTVAALRWHLLRRTPEAGEARPGGSATVAPMP